MKLIKKAIVTAAYGQISGMDTLKTKIFLCSKIKYLKIV